jgi:hypothetical protein
MAEICSLDAERDRLITEAEDRLVEIFGRDVASKMLEIAPTITK